METDNAIKKETLYLLYGMLILSALMEVVYIVIGKWNYFVLIGNIIGAGVSMLNFYLMALTVKRALTEDAGSAKKRMKMSQQIRNLMMFVIIVAAASLTAFNIIPEEAVSEYIIALVLPLLFNRIIIAIRARNVVE